MRSVQRGVTSALLAGLAVQAALLAGLALTVGVGRAGLALAGAYILLLGGLLEHGLRRSGATRFGPANAVTLARAMLVGGVLSLVAGGFATPQQHATLVALATLALLGDNLDGRVARRTGTVSELGARFDMEVDAFLILVLSVPVAAAYGWWVLAIGAARYLHLAAGWLAPWLAARVPPRYWRKPVAAVQGIVLTLALAGLVPRAVTVGLLATALILLAESFGRDDVWLWRRRQRILVGLPEPALVWLPVRR